MALKWSDVAASAAFQALTPDEQEEARQQYFDDVVASQVPEEDLELARSQFDEDTYISSSGGPMTRGGRRGPPSPAIPEDPRVAGARRPEDPEFNRALERLPGNIATSAKAQLKEAAAGTQRFLADRQASMDVAKAEGYRRYETDDPRVKAQQERGALEAEERAGAAELEQGRAQRATRRAQAEAQAAIPADAGPVERAVQSGLSSAAITMPIVTLGAAVPGGQIPALVALGGMTGSSRYGELRAAGVDEGTAALSGAALGGLEGLTERFPLGTLAKKSPFVDKAMEFLVQDLLGENVSSLAQLADDYRLQLRDDVTVDDIKATIQETSASTVVGAGAQLSVTGLLDQVLQGANARAVDRQARSGIVPPQPSMEMPSIDVETEAVGTNYTPPDSLSAQMGLTPIVVPNITADKRAEVAKEFGLDQLQENPNVGLPDGATAVPAAGGASGSGDIAGGVATAGSALAVGGQPVVLAAAPGGDRQQVDAVSAAGGEQAAPLKQWFGRAGDGYKTEGDAQQALPGRQRMHPELAWKIEPMPNGKYRLAGYAAQAAVQKTDAVQKNEQATELAAPAAGSVRFYHGGSKYEGGPRWLTESRTYARDYRENGILHYVDVPETYLKARGVAKSFEDEGTSMRSPYVHWEAPEEIARNLKPVPQQKATETTKDDYVAFPPASGTRGIPRAEMPQVKAEHRGALVNFLNARGVQHEQAEVPSADLKATQAEFSPAKVDQAKAFTGGDRSILVSSDGHIVDGHHQWIAKLDEGAPVKVIRLNAPIEKLLPLVREFPSSSLAGETSVTQTAEAIETEAQGSQAPGSAGAPGAVPAAGAGAQVELPGPQLEGLKLAPPAPTSVLGEAVSRLELRRGVKIAPVAQKDISAGHRVASAIARVFGKTLTVVRAKSGDKNEVPNGMISGYGGKHIIIAEDTEDAPLSVAVHEIYHSIPADQRKKLNEALLALTHEDRRAEFADRFGVDEEKIDEELPAYMAQAISKRGDFWEKLRERMGNQEFAEVARVILDKLNELLTGFKKDYGDEFLQKYVKDVARARDLLVEAYAIAQRSDKTESTEPVFSRRARSGDFDVSVEKDGSLTVEGDVEQIRALLPEDAVGRATKEGLKFRNSDAARVRAALEGRKVAYGRGGEVTERLAMRDGLYVGAPEKFNTPAKIPHLRKWLKQLALEGEPGRMWYENSSEEVLRMVGGSVHEARKFAALLAIYSPQAKVDTNATFALRAWAQHKAGQPINVKTRVMDQKATEALSDVDAFWSGEKTGNFVTNLLRRIDPSLTQGATIDMWMMRAAQYSGDAPGATQYAFMENEVNRLARELKWEPQQVQAAIWVAMKARMENKGVKQRTEAKSEKKGWIRFETRDGKKVRKILNKEAHRNNWLETAFAHTPSTQDTSAAKFDFGDGLRRHIGQVSFEARPGRSTGVLPGAHDAPYALQVQFQQDVQKALYDKDGVDLLAQKLGLLVDSDVVAPGVWQGEVSPSSQKSVAMAPGKGDDGAGVDPAQRKALDAYAAVLGLVARQEGVGWHRPFYTPKVTEHNGLDIDIGRPLNPVEAADLEKVVGKWMAENGKSAAWQSELAFISSPKGIRIVNFGVVSNDELRKQIINVAGSVLPDGNVRSFKSDGGMPTNDWKENPNGQAYVQGIRAAGRSDVLDWARDVLAPRVQDVFERYSEEHGWGEPGELRFSNRAASSADEGAVPVAEGVRGSAGPVAGDRRPYSEPGKRGDTLEGLPAEVEVDGQVLEFAGFKPAQDAARRYMERAGLPYSPPRTYAKIDRKRGRRIAENFTMMIHDPQNPEVKLAYQMMIRETIAQYREILGTGLQVEFIRGDDPYGNPRNAILDVVENNHLWVFPTSAGFGSDAKFDASDNPLLAETEFKISGETALANDVFRVVHDYFGHVKNGVGFRAEGEENAWRSHSAMYSPLARRAMTVETRAQNSWVNFGPHGEKNATATGATTVYADQKIGLMPKWVSEEGAADEPVFSNRAKQPTFYSALTRAAEAVSLTKAPAPQWLATLKNTQGVKEEELQWVGLGDWLMSLGRPATKQQVVDYLRANELQVEEVLKGQKVVEHDQLDELATRGDDLIVKMTSLGYTPNSNTNGEVSDITSLSDDMDWFRDPDTGEYAARDADRALPDEVVKLANELHEVRRQIWDMPKDGDDEATRYERYATPGGANYRELLLTLPVQKTWLDGSPITADDLRTQDGRAAARRVGMAASSTYRSSHWDEDNILAHVRFDERTDADGKRVLFIEEIQSDWHQAGRKRGYKSSKAQPPSKELLEKALADVRRAQARINNNASETSILNGAISLMKGGLSWRDGYPWLDGGVSTAIEDYGQQLVAYEEERDGRKVPDAPFKTTWPELAFKRMVRWAAENDFERIAWTTGEMQADRYDLSKHISTVQLHESNGGTRNLRAYDLNQNLVINETIRSDEDIAEHIGKEAAEKLLAAEPLPGNVDNRRGKTRQLMGLDLKVGGEGMIGFYDQILPKTVSKLVKRWGAKVSQAILVAPKVDLRKSVDDVELNAERRVHAVDVTPQMRDAALAGQPVFSNRVRREPKQTDSAAFKRWFGDSKVVDENGEPLVVYHGTDVEDDFEVFDRSEDIGFHFGSDLAANHRIGMTKTFVKTVHMLREAGLDDESLDGRRIIPVYLRIENPLRMDDLGTWDPGKVASALVKRGVITDDQADLADLVDREQVASWLAAKGYDGIVYKNAVEGRSRGADSYIALDARQIKSATGNDGNFDPGSPSIVASNRAAPWRRPWIFERDKLGNFRFAAGARAYRLVADIANAVLDKVKLKPVSSDLGRALRRMQADIAAAKEKAANVAGKLGTLSAEEREMISDVIEGELRAGITPTEKILAIAANMQHIMSEQTRQLVELGMMTDEAANRWEGKYLPRFYQKQFKDELKAWARAAKQLFGKKGAMQGIAGNSLKARGLFKDINVEELNAYEANGWEVRDPGFDPAESSEVTIWRDFTREERAQMNEIRDAMFRFVMGYMRSQKDIALGRLYRHIARTMASRSAKDGYAQVPDTSVEGTTAKRYGELAGKWVPQEVMDHLSAADSSEMNEIFKLYLKGLSAWKEGRTVLNPVSHVNNVISNVTMAHMAGVSYWDAHKYVGTVRDFVKKAPMVTEAKEAGLFGGTFNQADLLNNMPEQLKVLAGMTESAIAKNAERVWNAMSWWLRKPMQAAYEGEDLFFRYLIYRDARQRGLEPDAAVEYAQEYIFTYDDLPKGARALRDTVVPFFSWTYKAVPALARTAFEYPWRFAAPAAVLYGANSMMYAIAAAGEGEEPWWESVYRYIVDPEFRTAVRELEADERKDLPPWNKGKTAIGTPKVVRMGHDDVTQLPMFLDVSRLMPGGDMFDTENNAGGIPWFAPIDPGGPAVNILFGMFGNLDYFTGKNITSDADTDVEAAEKRAAWLYQSMAPAIAPFGYHFNRAMNAVAYGTDTTLDLGPVEYTGFGKDGLPVQPSLAALQTFGIKLRAVDLDQSRAIQESQKERLVRDLNSEIAGLKRLRKAGAISDEAFEDRVARAREKKARLKQGLTVEGDEEE